MPLDFFIPLENIRKPEAFSRFQGVQKEINDMKWADRFNIYHITVVLKKVNLRLIDTMSKNEVEL